MTDSGSLIDHWYGKVLAVILFGFIATAAVVSLKLMAKVERQNEEHKRRQDDRTMHRSKP